MDIWQKMIFPVRRAWLALSTPLKHRKNVFSGESCEPSDLKSTIEIAYSVKLRHFSTADNPGAGLLKLRDDVETCEYEDVQVMWEMLQKTETELAIDNHHKRKQQLPFWRVLVWSNHSEASSESATGRSQPDAIV